VDTRLDARHQCTVTRPLYARDVAQRGVANVIPFERQADVAEGSAPVSLALAPVELEPARRPSWPTLAALAMATGLASIGLGAWAVVDELRSEPKPSASTGRALDRTVALLSDSSAERHVLRGSVGRIALVVTGKGVAVLTLDGFGAASAGMTYQAWVVPPGSATPLPDATFDGSTHVVPLARRVSPGARVAVTLERSGGAERPSRPLRLVATRDSG
jgi:hypothetical protein